MNRYQILSIVAGILLLLAIPPVWPHTFYQILRWVVCVVAFINAIRAFDENKQGWTWTMGILAAVFNPIEPFTFVKETWVAIDMFAAGLMFVSTFKIKR